MVDTKVVVEEFTGQKPLFKTVANMLVGDCFEFSGKIYMVIHTGGAGGAVIDLTTGCVAELSETLKHQIIRKLTLKREY